MVPQRPVGCLSCWPSCDSGALTMRTRTLLTAILAPIGLLSGCTQGSRPSYGQQSGVVSLAPGQALRVWTGVVYRPLRVCNDLKSNGIAVIVIDDRQPVTLGPGICTEDYGSTVD